MPSKNRIQLYLSNEDKELFDRAISAYDINESELAREIIHAWLFANKLQLKKKR